MEVATILIGVAVFIISALMIYCISAFSMREKTFEEVIEEQRQQQEKEREKQKAEKKAEKDLVKKKNFKKGKQDKGKEKSSQVIEPEIKSEHKMVNLEIDPEIIDSTEMPTVSSAVRQRNVKKEKVKSILVNKDELSPIVQKSAELHHKPAVPKDEMELKKLHDKPLEKVSTSSSTSSPKKDTKSKSSTDVKENLPPKSMPHQPKDDIKPKQLDDERHTTKSKQAVVDAPLNGSRLVSAVKTAKLSDNEVQSLIDILLNRQGLSPTGPVASEVWNKKSQKGDPMSILKKQLEEKEKLLQEERNNAVALMSRTKEMKNELTAEKTKSASLEKRYQEQLVHQQAEMEALKSRMQHTHEQHLRETNTLQTRLQQVESGSDRATAQKITEENKMLQETITFKSKEIVSHGEKIKQLENKVKAVEAAKKGLESKTNLYEDKIHQLETMQKEVDKLTSQRVEEVTHELRKAESRNTSLTHELQTATGALGTAQGEVTLLKAKLQELESHLSKGEARKESEGKLQESERKCQDLEKNVKNLEKQLADVSQRFDITSTEMQRLQQDNKSLTDANKVMQEKLVSAPANKSNGNVHKGGMSLEEHERVLSKKAQEITDLTSGLESQKKTVSTLQTQLDVKAAELTDLQAQLSQQKVKNNELREKNWKAMEALEKSEKSTSEKVEKALKSARELGTSGVSEVESFDKSALQKLFPDIKVADKLVHKEWVTAFQKQAQKKLSSYTSLDQLQKLEAEHQKVFLKVNEYEKQISELQGKLQSSQSSASSVDPQRYSMLETENKQLKADVHHYSSIVSDTESKLRQLEKSIDEEEKKWHEKLKQAKSEGQQMTGSSQRISELENLVSVQEGQIQEYRSVLSVSENRLKGLESKIGAEEKSWQEKLSAAQNELTQMKNKFTSLKQELNASQGSQEMKTKVERLETELKEAEEKIAVITKEKDKIVVQLEESQKHIAGGQSSQDLNELRTQLDKECKKNKELSMNIVKLNGIIKTGQDALSQEQGLVKKLQQSLDSKSMSSGISDIDEADQLRAKLVDKQRLLEREMATNKSLSERLASPATENGTSV